MELLKERYLIKEDIYLFGSLNNNRQVNTFKLYLRTI